MAQAHVWNQSFASTSASARKPYFLAKFPFTIFLQGSCFWFFQCDAPFHPSPRTIAEKNPRWYHQRWRSHNSKMATPGKGEISTVTSDGFPRSNREFYAEKKETNNLFTLRQKMRLGKKERKKESCRSYHAQNQFQDSAHRRKENSLITGIKPFG